MSTDNEVSKDMASLKAVKRLSDTIKKINELRGFDYSCLEKMKVVSASDEGCVCEMTVEKEHVNRNGVMHGGCTATLVDAVSSLAYITTAPDMVNVSVDLSVSYLNAIKLGEVILIEAKNQKIGRKLAFLEVAIRRKRDGQLVATGKQTQLLLHPDVPKL